MIVYERRVAKEPGAWGRLIETILKCRELPRLRRDLSRRLLDWRGMSVG